MRASQASSRKRRDLHDEMNAARYRTGSRAVLSAGPGCAYKTPVRLRNQHQEKGAAVSGGDGDPSHRLSGGLGGRGSVATRSNQAHTLAFPPQELSGLV
jgi:hypothetical protein